MHTTIQLGLTRAAQSALGNRQGGVAVIRPRDGAVLALAGLAVSAPQPPGSTFKIVTLSAARAERDREAVVELPGAPVRALSGVKLHNAATSPAAGRCRRPSRSPATPSSRRWAPSSGARSSWLAERFGFNERPQVPAAKPSSIRADLRDSLAVGAAAIGQERDLATPLQMASVGATIANNGVRVRPRIVREAKVVKRRVVRRGVAATVRDFMIGVVPAAPAPRRRCPA